MRSSGKGEADATAKPNEHPRENLSAQVVDNIAIRLPLQRVNFALKLEVVTGLQSDVKRALCCKDLGRMIDWMEYIEIYFCQALDS